MISKWIITGDCHQQFSRFRNLDGDETTGVIILGDVGLNYNLNESDRAAKKGLCKQYPFVFYCVRGNHEARPGEHLGMKMVHDEDVGGTVWIEEEFPRIRYFCDWGCYKIKGMNVLVIGGAYSVDKPIRIANGWKWFENEQLAQFEMDACMRGARDIDFDLILSHTCPLSLQPTDLFLSWINQSTVDNSMEIWMEELSEKINWNIWLFAHYHTDRVEWPHVEIFYQEMEPLQDILARWARYDENGELDWWIPVGPKFQKLVEKS